MWLKNRLSHRASPRLKKARVEPHASGFALAELAIAVVIAGMMIISGMAYTKRQLQNDTAHALAEQYKTVNNAVGTYMVNHWDVLIRLPENCGYSTWLVGASPIDPAGTCTKSLGPPGATTTVINALQPTIANLVNLGYLQQGLAGPLLQPDTTINVRQIDGTAAPHTFGVRIEVLCTGSATTDLTQCLDPTIRRDLRSVVFNTLPYANVDDQLYNILGEALRVLPNDAGMSIPLPSNAALNLVGRANLGPLDLTSDGNFINMPNPVRVFGAAGQDRIMGVRGGYGSSGFQQFTRRDGSAPPLQPWNFNNQDLTGVKQLTANSIAGLDYIYGSKINAVDGLKIPIKNDSNACDTTVDNIAWDSTKSPPALLVCDNTIKMWVRTKSPGIDPNNSITVYASLAPGVVETTDRFFTIAPNGYGSLTYTYLTLPAANWGMPSVTLVTTPEMSIYDKDSYCTKINGKLKGYFPFISYGYYDCEEYTTENKEIKVATPANFELKIVNGIWMVSYDNTKATAYQQVGFKFYKINQ